MQHDLAVIAIAVSRTWYPLRHIGLSERITPRFTKVRSTRYFLLRLSKQDLSRIR